MDITNIALVFDDNASTLIENYSTSLLNGFESTVHIGQNSKAHLTLLQVAVEPETRKKIWKKCESANLTTPMLEFAGLTVLPSSSGGAWVEISVLKTKELQALQSYILSLLPSGISPVNAIDDGYRPHVTVAHLAERRPNLLVPLNYAAVRQKNVKTKLALGIGTEFDPCLAILR